MKLKIKKQNTILISLLALGLAACNGGGGGSSSSGGGDPTPPNPPAPVVYPHNGLTMTIKQKIGGDSKVNLAKTFGHTQYYLIVTNNNVESVTWSSIQYDTYFESTAATPYNPAGYAGYSGAGDIVKYVMNYDGGLGNGIKACEFNTPRSGTLVRPPNTLNYGESCVYQLNAMWADNRNTATSTFNWKMSYGIKYGSETSYKWVGKDCSLYPQATCASAAEIESADNNQNLSYYLPNHSNAVGTDVAPNGLFGVLSNKDYSTGGSNGTVTNMTGDILWVPSATALTGSVSRYSLNYNSNTNTLTRGSLLNTYTGGTNWLKGGASSNLSGDAFFQYTYANDFNVEAGSISSMLWYPGLDGAMYASSQNSAYGVLKVTSNGDGTFTSTRLPYDFQSPARTTVEAVGANGNILTTDFTTENNYCYINNGNNSYTKTAVGSMKYGRIVNSVNYVHAQSNYISESYIDFSGKSLVNTVVQPNTNGNPVVATPINMNDCSTNNGTTNYLVDNTGNFAVSNKFIVVGTSPRVINLNTISDGSDGN